MSQSIHDIIKNYYDKNKQRAFETLQERKNELYLKVPRIMEIDDDINQLGIEYNKKILMSEVRSDAPYNEMSIKIDMLKKERMQLIVAHGYPMNFLEDIYTCPICKDMGFVGEDNTFERCTCYKQLLIKYSYESSNMKLTETDNFSTFDEKYYPSDCDEDKYGIKKSPRENILDIREKCMTFIDNFDCTDEKNLFFCGPTGIGKTFLASCIAAELLKRNRTVLYQTAPVLFDLISKNKLRSFKDEDYEDSVIKNIMDVELLIIDDLGTESQTASRYAELLNILNIRQLNDLSRPCKIIISTNIEANKLYEYYTERIASRIIGNFALIRFAGVDIRRIKKSIASKP